MTHFNTAHRVDQAHNEGSPKLRKSTLNRDPKITLLDNRKSLKTRFKFVHLFCIHCLLKGTNMLIICVFIYVHVQYLGTVHIKMFLTLLYSLRGVKVFHSKVSFIFYGYCCLYGNNNSFSCSTEKMLSQYFTPTLI